MQLRYNQNVKHGREYSTKNRFGMIHMRHTSNNYIVYQYKHNNNTKQSDHSGKTKLNYRKS